MKKKRLSPFSKEFWIEKGYSEEDAEYKRNSIRPIRKEYWIEKGFSEEEAIKKAIETKNNNNKKGAKKSAGRAIEDMKKASPRCVEYWIEKGFSENMSLKKVAEIQATFSLEKCIKKYGYEKGILLFEERQEKWQNTLKSKSPEEIREINKNKNPIKIQHFNNIDECINDLYTTRNIILFKTFKDFLQDLEEKIQKKPYLIYYTPSEYIEAFVPNIQKDIFERLNIDLQKELANRNVFKGNKKHLLNRGKIHSYRKKTKEGLLRSSFEIYFYDKVKELFPELDIKVDKNYPESSFRYDFKILDEYIEVCPMLNHNKKYNQKMMHKKKVFGCILLETIKDIDEYIEGLKCKLQSKT